MQEKTSPLLLYFTLLGITACLMLITTNSQASNSSMMDKYELIKDELDDNAYGIPIYIESRDENNTMRGDVYGILHYPFNKVRHALAAPEHWCEIAPQHPNIKACTYKPLNNHCELTFYSGRKFYEKADDVYQLPHRFHVEKTEELYFQAKLTSETGPMGTKDYQIKVEVIPLEDSISFIHFSYSYRYNFFTRLGMQAYLTTFGRNKIGFTIVDRDEYDEPVYVHGIRGIIERNAVRYYLAIQSYLDTAHLQAIERFSERLKQWFDLTERHHPQLYELQKEEYLKYKQMEYQDQLRLQQQLNSASQCPEY